MSIDVTFLRDTENGGDVSQPLKIAQQLAAFISAAQTSLHMAIYDFRIHEDGPLYPVVMGAIKERAQAGVEVKIAFDMGKPGAEAAGADLAPEGTGDELAHTFQGTSVQIKAVTDLNPEHGDPRLMHNKYIIRDGQLPSAAVWTGSANWTDDTWTFQENNLLQVPSQELAKYYETDFQELFDTGNIDSTGENDRGTVTLDDGTRIDVAFSPGEGNTIDQEVAQLIASARQRIRVASMLISSRHILYALQNAIRRQQVPDIHGIYDSTQMQQTILNWQDVPHNLPLVDIFQEVVAGFAAKVSIPYSPGGKHNFMHSKVVVCDDSVFMGSFNLSHSATMNAENALVIHNAGIADQYVAYIDLLIAQYKK
ncbi:MAG TPA: phosphatidylserine/phosphatidylglycerophosphate/cardiolipin synthase family protein [Anaerolineae bacterium]|jgi:phosphatidylserine/phosphatidylglycerophosphate/cardiolipin synthase-like enzyme